MFKRIKSYERIADFFLFQNLFLIFKRNTTFGSAVRLSPGDLLIQEVETGYHLNVRCPDRKVLFL